MALRPIQLKVQLFLKNRGRVRIDELDRSRRAITWLMFGLSQVNREWLETYPGTPELYSSSVLYKLEAKTEIWQDIPTTLARGFGDCEDLACWRIAELQAQGINAMPYLTWRSRGNGSVVYHALVRHPDGLIEDPSRALGMHGHPITRSPVYIDIDPPDDLLSGE